MVARLGGYSPALPICSPSQTSCEATSHSGRIQIRTVNGNELRWGILGTAQIARKNWKAIQLTGNSAVTAVASRDPERSRRFIAECQAEAPMKQAPKALGSYAELLSRP